MIITHRTFAGSLAPLTALRQKQGFAVETVDVEDIYDEFSFGERSPQAIRDFLASPTQAGSWRHGSFCSQVMYEAEKGIIRSWYRVVYRGREDKDWSLTDWISFVV